MARPIVNKITPFDAEINKELSFSWNGDQSHANRLILYNADTMNIVYDRKIPTFSHNHIIPSGTLSNGKKWIAQFQTFDMEGIESELSDKLYFQTFKTPLFYFYNLKDEQTIQSASYEAVIYYLQENYEDIQSYKFYLYDGTKTLLNESETFYDSHNIKYTYRGLDNHSVYYLRCHGITSNGMEIDTGYISLYTDYRMPSTYGIIYAQNDPLHGYIKYHTNIKVIQCVGNKDYQFENGMIDLRNDSIRYEEGFVMEDDFSLRLKGMYLNQTADILELHNTQYSLTLNSYLYEDGTTRFKITVPNGLGNYILYSSPLAFDKTDMICILIRRVNDIYQLEVFLEYDFSRENNSWYGQQMPGRPEAYDVWIDSANPLTYVVDKNGYKQYYTEEEPTDTMIAVNDIWI